MSAAPLRIVFAGTPEFAAAHLSALIEDNFHVVSAYSQPDRPTGRGKKLLPTPVKAVAEQHGIAVHQPLDFSDPATLETLRSQAADVMVVVAYGLLLPPAVLALPRYGCLNVHASLLPRWRGAAPIERAILAGDTVTGVCIMQMEQGLDTGPVLKRLTTPIRDDDTAATLTQRLQQLGCEALRDILRALPLASSHGEMQDGALATYARKLTKEDSQIVWQRSAQDIHNQIRALFPRSPAWCLHEGKRLRLVRARVAQGTTTATPGTIIAVSASIHVACGDGKVLEVFDVQTEGKPAMSISSLLNGHPGYFARGMGSTTLQ